MELNITKNDFKKLQKQLRDYSKSWAKDVSESICNDESVNEEMIAKADEIKVRNTVNNVVRDFEWRILVFKHMGIVLKKYQKSVEELLK